MSIKCSMEKTHSYPVLLHWILCFISIFSFVFEILTFSSSFCYISCLAYTDLCHTKNKRFDLPTKIHGVVYNFEYPDICFWENCKYHTYVKFKIIILCETIDTVLQFEYFYFFALSSPTINHFMPFLFISRRIIYCLDNVQLKYRRR